MHEQKSPVREQLQLCVGDFTPTVGGPGAEGQKRGEGELRRGPGWAAGMHPMGRRLPSA